MTRTTPPKNDPEEARKELLATLQASRELGPEMDDALTDRFMERLTTLRPTGSFDQATTRSSLQTLLKTAQGSDQVGDDALAATFFAGIQPPKASVPMYAPYGVQQAPMGYGSPASQRGFAQVAPLLVVGTIAIVALVLTQGHAIWFMWFLIPMFVGWGRRNQRHYHRLDRDQQRAYRHDRIVGRDDVYPPLPPSSRPPEIL